MQSDDIETQKNHQGVQSTNTIDGGQKDNGSARISKKEVIQMYILRRGKGASVLRTRWTDRRSKKQLTFSCSMHSTLHSLSVSTRPPSGDRSISSGSGSLKSSFSNRSSTQRRWRGTMQSVSFKAACFVQERAFSAYLDSTFHPQLVQEQTCDDASSDSVADPCSS